MATVILNVAYLALISSTMFRTVLWLRAMLITGAICFVVYGAVTGITSMVVWNLIIGVLHSRQLILFLRARRTVTLSDEDEHFRQSFFPELDSFDFASLWSLGTDERYDDVRLTAEDHPVNAVYLVLDGEVGVRTKSAVTTTLGTGSLVGEISFLTGGMATADTYAIGEVRVREWEQSRLATLDHLNPKAAKALRRYIGNDVANKLV